ncbi:MAG: hypothetical protein R2745_14930 [Vicinamibacterales bacterium]
MSIVAAMAAHAGQSSGGRGPLDTTLSPDPNGRRGISTSEVAVTACESGSRDRWTADYCRRVWARGQDLQPRLVAQKLDHGMRGFLCECKPNQQNPVFECQSLRGALTWWDEPDRSAEVAIAFPENLKTWVREQLDPPGGSRPKRPLLNFSVFWTMGGNPDEGSQRSAVVQAAPDRSLPSFVGVDCRKVTTR